MKSVIKMAGTAFIASLLMGLAYALLINLDLGFADPVALARNLTLTVYVGTASLAILLCALVWTAK